MSYLSDKVLEELKKRHPQHKYQFEISYYNLVKNIKNIEPFLLSRSKRLRADIYDKTIRVVYEINGIQHYKYNNKFHKDVGDFMDQKRRDNIKKELLTSAGIQLVVINDDNFNDWKNNEPE